MGKITEKEIDTLPESEKKKVDKAKEEVIKTMPKKVKKTEDKPKKAKKEIDVVKLREDLDTIGGWIADVDDDLSELSDLVNRIAKRMGLE